MLRIILAEDDPYMLILLRGILKNIPWVKVIMEVNNGLDLVKKVNELNPDVVFLDIDMPEMNGLDAASRISNTAAGIYIIFATAYSDYTHEAFKLYAFDYLVKPYKIERIHETLSRIKNIKEGGSVNGNTSINKELLEFTYNGISYYVDREEIILVTRITRKTYIYTNNQVIETYKSLNEIHEMIGVSFFRCHKGYIINVNAVKEILPYGNKTYIVKLGDLNETALITMKNYKVLRELLGFIH